MRRARVHMPGIVEYRNVGVIAERDDTTWRIEADEGRTYFAEIASSKMSDLHVGDRVEFGPLFASSAAAPFSNRGMVIIRKLNGTSS